MLSSDAAPSKTRQRLLPVIKLPKTPQEFMQRHGLNIKRRSPVKNNTLDPVHPNAGIEAAYKKKLEVEIERMHRSLLYWLSAAYKRNVPELTDLLALDASPASVLIAAVRSLRRRWQRKFDNLALELGKYFATEATNRSDAALKDMLKRGGFSVKLKWTPAMNDTMQAAIHENVGLIKSIAQHHLAQVEGLVMRSVQEGRDLEYLTKALQHQFGVTQRRAAFIARDQNNKCTATVQKVRYLEAGITKAIWVHSGGGRIPRPTHVQAGKDRVVYDVAKGWWDPHEKKWIWPGTLVNCFPGDTLFGFENGIKTLWRSFFNGPMIDIKIGSDIFSGTPNHPILTKRGWVPIRLLNDGDEIVCMSRQCFDVVHHNKNQRIVTFDEFFKLVTFDEFFKSNCVPLGNISRNPAGFNFHGDIPDAEVDEVSFYQNLPFYFEPGIFEDIRNLDFSKSDSVASFFGISGVNEITNSYSSGFTDHSPFLLNSRFLEPVNISGAPSAHLALLSKDAPDITSTGSESAEMFSYGGCSEAGFIQSDNLVSFGSPIDSFINNLDSHFDKSYFQCARKALNSPSGFLKVSPFLYELRRVTDKVIRNFSGHVYTLETYSGFFTVSSVCVQVKNCRCVSRPYLPGFN